MEKSHKKLSLIITVLCIAALAVFAAAYNGKKITLTFETNGGTEIAAVTGLPGDAVVPPSAPTKYGYIFDGWYLDAQFTGDSVRIPTTMPEKSTTYYAKFVIDPECARGINYDINLNGAAHGGNITDSLALPGETVTVKDGADYNVTGNLLFVGWSTAVDGNIQFTDGKAEGQYNAGDVYTVTENNIMLYAQWAVGFKQRNGDDIVYFYEKLFGSGLGGAITFVGGEQKLGFASVNADTGYIEFDFYYDDGTVSGRINPESETEFTYANAAKGSFIGYDYATEDLTGYILTADGYSLAILSSVLGDVTKTEAYGTYEYNEKYGDYTFSEVTATGEPVIVDGVQSGFYFTVSEITVDGTASGIFMMQGRESGSFMLYDNGALIGVELDLGGYGTAKLYEYDELGESRTLIAEGAYKGTELYADFMGEWKFFSETAGVDDFEFYVNAIADGESYANVFIKYNEYYNKTFNASNGNGDTLYMDGYGNALYSSGGIEYVGNCVVSESGALVIFVPYIDDGNGGMTAAGRMYFNIDYAASTFTVNSTGYMVDGNTLVGYTGTSKIIVVPDGVTAIADNVFNYTHSDTGLSIVSAVIPASVETIGVNAFENEYSLSRVTFLSETPIQIDWSNESDPFRWPAGNFIIVVPQNSLDAYKAAWSGCPYVIKGSVDVTELPEFEVVSGVLVRYNKPSDAGDSVVITIPDGVTEIADGVFRGLTYITSVDFNNVTVIGDYAFEYCTALATATFTKVETIGDFAFAGSGISGTVELPEIVEIGASAFASCTGLRRVRLGALVAEIGDMAFAECQVVDGNPPLYVELTGSSAPLMGERITVGNIAFRFAVQNILTVKRCYAEDSWSAYCRHLYIESGDEKGAYMCGSDILELDGRAIFDNATVYMYEIDGSKITLYLFDGEEGEAAETVGTIENGTITVRIEGVDYAFEKVNGSKSYAADYGSTLVCDPLALRPEYYDGLPGYADVTFNGKAAQLSVSYTAIKIIAFRDTDGKLYDYTLTFDGNLFAYVRTATNTTIANITCADGSVINIHYSGSLIYVYGELKIDVGNGAYMNSWSDYNIIATESANNVFTFTRNNYLGKNYNITITVSDDYATFTYSYTVA